MAMSVLLAAAAPPSSDDKCRTDEIAALLHAPSENRILISAHRGAHKSAPENSLAAISAAINFGAAFVEIDIRRTSDGVPVLMHDRDLARTTNASGEVSHMTMRDLATVQLRNADETVSHETVPTLRDALRLSRGRAFLMLDSKVDEPSDIAAIAEVVRDMDMMGAVLLYDFDPVNALAYHAAMPGAIYMTRANSPELVATRIEQIRPDLLHIETSYATSAWTAFIDRLGAGSFAGVLGDIDAKFAAGDARQLRDVIAARPDIIQTDHPAELIAIMRAAGLHPAILDQKEFPRCRFD